MEELASPFKSPSVNDMPSSSRRARLGSGSSVSSTEKEPLSPHNRLNFYNATTATAGSHYQVGNEGRDENDPPAGCSTGNSSGDSRVNPFEKDILAGLQGSFWSPSILEINDTPPQRSWAIEHLSQLFPKDIENSPSTHQNSFPVDSQMEAKAQADIDAYFSQGPIVPTPSPMKQNVTNVQGEVLRFGFKATSTDVHCGQSPIARGGIVLNGANIKKLKKPVPVTERWTQTALSLPMDLPSYIEQLLFQHSQDVEYCGASGEAVIDCSQKSEASSDQAENGDTNDSGKNSSSLNNSIRRRLELSFGEDPDGEESSQGLPQKMSSPSPVPFHRNHLISTPPNSSTNFQFNTTTSDLELQLLRCEFTPEARPSAFVTSPGITPIHDDNDDFKPMSYHHTSSTPRRNNATSKRWVASKEDSMIPPSSPMDQETASSSTSSSSSNKPGHLMGSSSSDKAQCNSLRRTRVDNNPAGIKKRSSTSFFDDSQLMDDSSPPAKLYRRTSKDDENS